jgi:hypothetical protein
MVGRLSLLLAAAAWSAPLADAHAMCVPGRTYLSPPSGTAVPRNPSLLVVNPRPDTPLRPLVDGRPAPFGQTRLDDQTVLLQVATGRGHLLTLDVGGEAVSYPIDFYWRPRAGRLAGRARRTNKWSCSFTDVVAFRFKSDAIGFLVEWREGEAGSAWVATSPVASAPRFTDLPLGHRSCQAWNIPQALYRSGGTVSLTALHADGGRERLGLVRLESALEIPDGPELLDLWAPLDEVEHPVHHTGDRRPIAVLALAAALVPFLFSRRRRPSTFTR